MTPRPWRRLALIFHGIGLFRPRAASTSRHARYAPALIAAVSTMISPATALAEAAATTEPQSGPATPAETTSPDLQRPLRIAIAAPFSGARRNWGQTIRSATEESLARPRELEPGLPSDVHAFDDGCAAGTAISAAKTIVTMKPDLVIGHPCASAAIAAAPIYAASGVLFIAIGVRHPELTTRRAGPLVFRMAGRDDRQAEAAAASLTALAPAGTIAILHDETRYARSLAGAAASALKARGREAKTLSITAGQRSYASEIETLRHLGASAVFFAGYPPEAKIVRDGVVAAHLDVPFIASESAADEAFITGIPAASRVAILVAADGFEDQRRSDDEGAFASRPESGAGSAEEPRTLASGLANLTRRALTSWLAAASHAGTFEPLALAPQLVFNRASQDETVPFDSNGDAVLPSFLLATVKSGRLEMTPRSQH